MKALVIAVVAGSFVLAACSPSPSAPPPPTSQGTTPGAPPSGPLAAPPAGQGFQFEMTTAIAAGQEDERCKFVTLPSSIWVNEDDVRFTPGSHHFLLWETSYASIPTTDINGNTVDTSQVFDCVGGPSASWSITQPVGGSQSANGTSLISGLPANAALHVEATVLILDLHVLNATAQPLDTDARINLWTVPASQITIEAGTYFFYNPFIKVPAHAKAAARMSCPVTSDVTLVNGQSHMHARGLGAVANLVDGSDELIEELYASDTWTDPAVKTWSPGVALKAGQAIDYQCNYQSDQDNDVTQGLTTKDEMCVFFGLYYPRDKECETCSKDGTFANLSSAATYIGTGSASCASSLSCIASAQPISMDHGDSLYGCMVDSCPKVGPELTRVVDCERSAVQGSCASTCQGGEAGCGACIEQTCGDQLSACESATCN
jgi:copper type II ascorbate-dependent monooxygenase-like protein